MALDEGELTREQVIERMTRDDAPFAIDTFLIRGVQHRVLRHEWPNLHALFHNSLRHGDADFLVFEKERLSFVETYCRAAAIAQRLVRDCGIRKGDRVGIAMRNYPEWCLAYMAITSIGAVAVALNAWWKGGELEYGLKDSQTKLVFVDQERLDRLPMQGGLGIQVVVARPTKPLPQGVKDMADWLKGPLPKTMPSPVVAPEDEAALYYTSGSVGHPKGVLLTHRAVISAVMSWDFALLTAFVLESDADVRQLVENWLKMGKEAFNTLPVDLPQTSVLLNLPLFHVTGCHVMFLLCFSAGRKVVMMHKWTAEKALELIEAEQITHTHGVPTQSWELINSPDFDRRNLDSVQSVGAGGAARPAEHLRQIMARLPNVSPGIGYGLTETCGLATSIAGEDYLMRPTSVGRVVPPVSEVKIIDEDGTTLGPGEDGEICFKSPANFSGYWNLPQDTAATLRDGWLHTGDIGHLDSEGFLYITDRAKDIVIRGGENISCTEVESALCEHPAVFEAAVFGVPDERLGEVVWADVMVNPSHRHDAGGVDEEALKAHVAERLAAFKVPARIRLRREHLPRGATEKIDKRRIRTEALGKSPKSRR